MSLFTLSRSVRRDPRIEAWFAGSVRLDPEIDARFPEPADALRTLARTWFEVMRGCGPDVRELFHDGCPVACVAVAPFGYVNVYKAYAAVGFFDAAALDDPARLLEGAGKRMRHVKLRPHEPVDEAALEALIAAAYRHIRARLGAEL